MGALFLYEGSCMDACPSEISVPDPVTNSCLLCHASCSTCSGDVSFCSGCALSSEVLFNGSCVSSCPHPAMIIINQICLSCDLSCLTCSLSVDNCTSCDNSLLHASNSLLDGNQCVDVCPDQYYSNNSHCVVCS